MIGQNLFLYLLFSGNWETSKTNYSTCFISKQQSYELVWSDEFDYEGRPDSTKWHYENGFVRNYEDQWYQKENAGCKDGYLIITGKKEHKPNPNYKVKSSNWKTKRKVFEYTSASVAINKQHAFQFGRLEVKAKIDAQESLWPAIWILDVSGQWPSNREVDIMEYYDDKILANFAPADSLKHKAIWDSEKIPFNNFGGKNGQRNFMFGD